MQHVEEMQHFNAPPVSAKLSCICDGETGRKKKDRNTARSRDREAREEVKEAEKKGGEEERM